MRCARSLWRRRQRCCICRRVFFAKRPAKGSLRRLNRASAGYSWKQTLSPTWTGFTLAPGKRR